MAKYKHLLSSYQKDFKPISLYQINLDQRKIDIDFKSTFDNNSPSKLRIYALIYGIKNEFLHNLDQGIYDWKKAYEISSHMPINMNGFDILKTSHYLHGYLITNLFDKTIIINGSKRILLPSESIIKQIQILYNSFKLNYEKINIQIYYGFRFAFKDFIVSDQNTHIQTLNMNLTLQNGHFKVKLINNDVPNEELDILINIFIKIIYTIL